MNPRNPSQSEIYEHEPQGHSVYAVDMVIDMLQEAHLPTEEIVWLRDVLFNGLPGADTYRTLRDMRRTDYDIREESATLIDSAIASLHRDYIENVESTIGELNTYIASRTNMFIVDMPEKMTLTSLGAVWSDGIASLQLLTPIGVNGQEVASLSVDSGYLNREEQVALVAYRKLYEL